MAPPFIPKQGPSDGSRRQIAVRLPIRFKASPRPTVVVVLPSPPGVGLIEVTRISFPSGLPWSESMNSPETLALSWPNGRTCSLGIPSLAPTSWMGWAFARRAISMSVMVEVIGCVSSQCPI